MPSFMPSLPAPATITVYDDAGTEVRKATRVYGTIFARDEKTPIYEGGFEVAAGLEADPAGLRVAIIARVTMEQDAYDAMLAAEEAKRRGEAPADVAHLEF